MGGEDVLRQSGCEVVNIHDPESKKLMEDFIKKEPELWYDVVPTTRS
jgi:hypothetical protein